MAARKFTLPLGNWVSLVGFASIGAAILAVGIAGAFGTFPVLDSYPRAFGKLMLWIPVGASLVFVALRGIGRAWRTPRTVRVGTDGVLIGRRFIPYPSVERVEHARCARRSDLDEPSSRPGEALPPGPDDVRCDWIVSLVLHGGETVKLVTRSNDANDAWSEDALGSDLARAIDEGLAASRRHRRRPEDVEAKMVRGERTGVEWVAGLRRLGSERSTVYRGAAPDVEGLSRLLDDPRRKPSARAAAAVVLTAAGDTTAAARLRIAAETTVDQRVRIALENVADEKATADALEALDDAEREPPKRAQLPRGQS